jgi:uncharacterized delta-60 repeat protein
MKGLITCFLLIVTSSFCVFSFTKTFGGEGLETGSDAIFLSDGSIIAIGNTSSFSFSGKDVFIVKTDASGRELTRQVIGGELDDYASSLLLLSDGNIMVSGYTQSYGIGGYDIWVIILNDELDTLRTVTFGGEGNDFGYSLSSDGFGNILLCAMTTSFGDLSQNVWILRLNENGDTLETFMYGGSSTDKAYTAEPLTDGGFVFCGFTNSFSDEDSDGWLVRANADGSILWQRTFSLGHSEYFRDLSVFEDGRIVVTGTHIPFVGRNQQAFILIYSDSGDTLSYHSFTGERAQELFPCAVLSDGSVMAAGRIDTEIDEPRMAWLLKLSPSSGIIWQNIYGGHLWDDAMSLSILPDGGFLLCGTTYSFGNGSGDIYLIRTDSTGSTGEESYGFNVKRGWNLLSNPFSEELLSSSFSFSIPPLYKYSSAIRSYESSLNIFSGNGFWLLSPLDTTIMLSAIVSESSTIELATGWNLIGVSREASSDSLIMALGDGVIPPFFEYDPLTKTYLSASSLSPGKGYWIVRR